MSTNAKARSSDGHKSRGTAGTVIPGATDFSHMVVTDTHEYISAASDNTVAVVAADGTLIGTLSVPYPTSMLVVGTTLYVDSYPSSIDRFDISTDLPSELAPLSLAPDMTSPMGLAYYGGRLWLVAESTTVSAQPGMIVSMNTDGSGITTFTPSTPELWSLQGDGANIYTNVEVPSRIFITDAVLSRMVYEYDISNSVPNEIAMFGDKTYTYSGWEVGVTPDGKYAVMNLRRFPIDDISGWTDWIHGSDYAGATDTAVASTKGLGGMLATSGAVTWPAPAPAVLIWGPDSTAARTAYPIPAAAGSLVRDGLRFSPDGSRLYAIAMGVSPSSTTQVSILPIRMNEPHLTMSGPSKVTLGNRLTFKATLKGAATGSSVTFFDAHGPIESCSTDPSGRCSITLRPTQSFYIHALFPGSLNIGSSETPSTIERVLVGVVGQMKGHHARAGRYALYRTGHAVHYRTSVTPAQPGGSVTAVVEIKVSTRWDWVDTYTFAQGGRGSRTILVTRLTGGSLLPGTYRIHSRAAGQGSLFGGTSRWVYFTVS